MSGRLGCSEEILLLSLNSIKLFKVKVMLHWTIFNDRRRCNIVHRTIFNATFCCGNMLRELESDSNTANIVARILLGLIRVKPSQWTFNVTLHNLLTYLLADANVVLKIAPCNILACYRNLPQQCCVKSCPV